MILRRPSRPFVWSWLLVLAPVVAGCMPQWDLQRVGKFQQAQQAFDQAHSQADYLRAAAIYQEILDSGIVSGGLLYNQGNAFMRAGERGRAIACYRRAYRYMPRDGRLLANLQSAALPGAPLRPANGVMDHVLFWQDWISYPGKFQAMGVLGAAAFLLGLLALFAPPRRLWRRTAWIFLLLTAVAAGSAAYDWYRFDHIRRGVVIADEVAARKGNAASYEVAFTKPLIEGMEFQLVERRGAWLQIELAGGNRGWVPEDTVVTY